MDWLLLYLGLLLVAALLLWLLPVTLLQCLQSYRTSSQQNRLKNYHMRTSNTPTPSKFGEPNNHNAILYILLAGGVSSTIYYDHYILFVCQNTIIFWFSEMHLFWMHLCKILFHRVQHREHLPPVQATDPGGTITMVTASGRSFTIAIKTDDTAVQETNPATPGELVLGTFSIPVNR